MKKTILLAIGFLVLCSSSLMAQSAFYDAKILAKYIDDNKVSPGNFSPKKETDLIDKLNMLRQKNDSLAGEKKKLEKAEKKGKIEDELKKTEEELKKITEEIADTEGQIVLVKQAKKDTIFTILKKYHFIESANLTAKQLNDSVHLNPFMKDFDFAGLTQGEKAKPNGLLKSSISKLGGLDVTNIANALADLMIDRAKQELTVAFFDRFKKFADENPEFRILFPKTTRNLENLLAYKYPEMLPALRTSFLEDIKQITLHLDDVLELPRYKELFKNLPEVTVAIRSLKLVHELETGASNAADVIAELASYPEWTIASNLQDAGAILKTVSIISQSLRSDGKNDNAPIWVSAKELKGTFLNANDPNTRVVAKIFMGLIYQQAKNQNIQYGTTKLTDELKKFDVDTFYDALREFIILSEKVNVSYRDLQTKIKSGGSISDDDYYNYISTSLDIVEYGFSLAKTFNADVTKAENYLSILRESNDLYKNIYTKEYNQAINNGLNILVKIDSLIINNRMGRFKFINGKSVAKLKIGDSPFVSGPYSISRTSLGYSIRKGSGSAIKEKVFGSLDASLVLDGDTIFVSSDKKNAFEKLLAFVEEVKPYALFIANVVEAENEGDIKNALDAVILPVGSSSIKKYTRCNFAIQSYLGAYWNVWNNADDVQSSWNDKFGVTAPIGLSWTPGVFSWRKGGSLSVFLPLLDIGAIVDYKLTSDTVLTNSGTSQAAISKDYSVELGQIFSPGLFMVYGSGLDLPLAVGFGAQYGPGLSKIEAGDNTVVNNPSWRFNFFLAVDLPFFNISNKSKYKNKARK